jgi:3',5'-cyclic AMP phosphodiesterase CpdA
VKLLAISDLHLRFAATREALARLPPRPDDWLIVAGDVGETEDDHRFAWSVLRPRFAELFWVPGNHDLWTPPGDPAALRGEALYERRVEICREHGVHTPEDPFVAWTGPGPACRVAPLFTLYDYSFRPDDVPRERAVEWAVESGILCTDESLLHPDPHPSRDAWCAERCRISEERLAAAAAASPLVLVNHWPLRRDLLTLRRVPRFSIWCGTRRSEDWHRRFRALAVVYGHLHVRRTALVDGVRFEEVSLGYPRDWDAGRGLEPYLRQVLPPPEAVAEGFRP